MSHEPCFYNQDWYLQEPFARDRVLPSGWFLLRKTLADESRGALPAIHQRGDDNAATLPYAIACAYAFFAYFLCTEGKLLWPHDYLWCVDLDHNNDQIYVGRYNDPSGINKNGFSIHRHLVIRSCYGVADYITMQGRK